MQVQLTEFASESFPLSIQLTEAMLKGSGEPAVIGRPAIQGRNGDPILDKMGSLSPIIKSGRETEMRFRRSPIGAVGTACLSVIGMIEPGRAIRLYRQIH